MSESGGDRCVAILFASIGTVPTTTFPEISIPFCIRAVFSRCPHAIALLLDLSSGSILSDT